MLDTLGVKLIRNTLDSGEHIFLNSILKEENPEAILVSFKI